MFKVCLVLALAIASAAAQEVADNAAPEPYSYGYSTDTHSAQEQRDPSGTVTGSYSLVGEDGRQRRVDYIADAAGFRAKVATNEVGTKSENPADVELNASEPTPAQFAAAQYVQSPPQVAYGVGQQVGVVNQQVRQVQQVQRVAAGPAVVGVQQPALAQSSYYNRQITSVPQAGYGIAYGGGYYPGYGYGSGYYGSGLNGGYYGAASNGYYGVQRGYGYGPGVVNYGNYNNHLPSQYYRSISSQTTAAGPVGYTVAPVSAGYTVNSNGYRYVSQPAGVVSSTVRTVPATSNLVGSSNYAVLQKRA